MQKFNTPCIKTGDFAKLCGTNKRTLIHYDEIGIFKPAGNYAVAYLKGDYYDSEYTYKRLFEWIDQNHFKTGEYSYKEAVIDELTTASSDEYLTKISVQIL